MGRLVRKPLIADFDAPLFDDGDLPAEAAAAPMTPKIPVGCQPFGRWSSGSRRDSSAHAS